MFSAPKGKERSKAVPLASGTPTKRIAYLLETLSRSCCAMFVLKFNL